MSIIYSILSFILGANYEIMRLCPIDFSKQMKRIMVAVLVSAATVVLGSNMFRDIVPLAVGVAVLLLYITFLCKMGGASFPKFLLGLAISAYIFYCASPFWGGINYLLVADPESIVIASIVGIVVLVLCFMPINFSDTDAGYSKLLQQRIEGKTAAGKLLVEERNNADKAIIRNKEQARVRLEGEIAKYTSERLLKAQKKMIDKLADKWISDVEKDLKNNTAKYIGATTAQPSTLNKTMQDELNNYVSELLKEKRKEFADIIVEKWAEEKKNQIKSNPNAFIS